MPAVICRCGCGCENAASYIGLDQKIEDYDNLPLICENCLGDFHHQDELEMCRKMYEDEVSENDKDNPRMILDRRLASGEITVDEYDKIKERLDSE